MQFEIRAARDDEFVALRQINYLSFNAPLPERGLEAERVLFDLSRTRCAFAGGKPIGVLGTFSIAVALPGGVRVPCGGTTIVSVLPTWRRRGVLSAMMRAHLDEVRERGEPMAALWASEGGIYGRYGFGMASGGQWLEFDARHVSMRADVEPAARVELRFDVTDKAPIAATMNAVYERCMDTRPGLWRRSAEWWQHYVLRDDPAQRDGGSAHRYLICESADIGPSGYAIYRQESNGGATGAGTVQIDEVMAADRGAHTALWHCLTHIDLFPKVSYWNAPQDDPLPLMLGNSFPLQRRLIDGLWVRPLDVASLLGSRRYLGDGRLQLTVRDAMYPDIGGDFLLDVTDGQGECRRTDASARGPRIELDIDALGALLLGGQLVPALAASGRLHADASALQAAARLLHWPVAPWSASIF